MRREVANGLDKPASKERQLETQCLSMPRRCSLASMRQAAIDRAAELGGGAPALQALGDYDNRQVSRRPTPPPLTLSVLKNQNIREVRSEMERIGYFKTWSGTATIKRGDVNDVYDRVALKTRRACGEFLTTIKRTLGSTSETERSEVTAAATALLRVEEVFRRCQGSYLSAPLMPSSERVAPAQVDANAVLGIARSMPNPREAARSTFPDATAEERCV